MSIRLIQLALLFVLSILTVGAQPSSGDRKCLIHTKDDHWLRIRQDGSGEFGHGDGINGIFTAGTFGDGILDELKTSLRSVRPAQRQTLVLFFDSSGAETQRGTVEEESLVQEMFEQARKSPQSVVTLPSSPKGRSTTVPTSRPATRPTPR